MKATIQTPFGEVTVTVDGGFIGGAEVSPDGAMSIAFYPPDKPPDDDLGYING